MKNRYLMNGNHAPMPKHSTEKTCYQGRMGVTATRTPAMAFRNPGEDGMRTLGSYDHVAYTPINDREPTGMEKGNAPYQASMGKMNNSFKDNV
jgi:hypothetical protein